MLRKNHLLTNLGQAIRKRRREQHLTQEALAIKTELHRTYISDLERGRRNASISTLGVVAEALETSISALTSGIDARLTFWLTSALSAVDPLLEVVR